MISVLMSVYNENIEWIQQSVTSILNQTYQNFEYIIVIDNPNLPKEINEYLEREASKDNRIHLIRNNINLGLSKSLNIGLHLACGEYIARMDADDISVPTRFEKELDYIKTNKADMVSCQRMIIDENDNEIGEVIHISANPNKDLPFSNFIVHPGVLMKKDVIQNLGGYRNFYKSQDYDLWLRMISNGNKICVMQECLLKYRVRKNSISSANALEQYYISEYQKMLYYQRKKTGKDQFSPSNLKAYISKKNISPLKKKKFLIAREQTNKAIKKFKQRKISFVINYIMAFFIMPEIPLKSTIAVIGMKL